MGNEITELRLKIEHYQRLLLGVNDERASCELERMIEELRRQLQDIEKRS